jgi:hypothetical protein
MGNGRKIVITTQDGSCMSCEWDPDSDHRIQVTIRLTEDGSVSENYVLDSTGIAQRLIEELVGIVGVLPEISGNG